MSCRRNRRGGNARWARCRLLDNHAIGVSAQASEDECDAPKGAAIPPLLVSMRRVTGRLMSTRRPGEDSFPPC
eukprot:3513804-Pleurochrysis_carterae.AAC.2